MQADYWKTYKLQDLCIYSCIYTRMDFRSADVRFQQEINLVRFHIKQLDNYVDYVLGPDAPFGNKFRVPGIPTTDYSDRVSDYWPQFLTTLAVVINQLLRCGDRLLIRLLRCGDQLLRQDVQLLDRISKYSGCMSEYLAIVTNYLVAVIDYSTTKIKLMLGRS